MFTGTYGCGPIGVGSGLGINEAAPQGNIVKSGTFESFGSAQVEGLVQIIVKAGTGTNVIRLESFSIESIDGYQLRAVVNGTDRLISVLRGTAGNFNYSTSVTGSQNIWTSVSIFNPITAQDLATAVLNF